MYPPPCTVAPDALADGGTPQTIHLIYRTLASTPQPTRITGRGGLTPLTHRPWGIWDPPGGGGHPPPKSCALSVFQNPVFFPAAMHDGRRKVATLEERWPSLQVNGNHAPFANRESGTFDRAPAGRLPPIRFRLWLWAVAVVH